MKTLLLFPTFEQSFSRYPPMGIAYLAAVLRQNDLLVDVIDASKYQSFDEFEYELKELRPDILGISVLSVYYEKALQAARIAKRALPNIITVFGGAHPTIFPEKSLSNLEVDIVVFGEGEDKLLDLVTTLNNGGDLSNVRGIFYKSRGEIIKTEEADYIEDMDRLPFPARDLLPMNEYLWLPPTLPLPYPSTSIMASRGCFGNCIYCQPTLRKLYGRKIRYRSPKNVVDEVVHLQDTYKLRGLLFVDDEPTWNNEWMLDFCEEMINRQVKIKWICASRVDTIDQNVIRMMKRAECIGIIFGVETGSQKILNYFRKGTKVEQVRRVFDMCVDEGIIARANIMIGAPNETLEDVQQTISMIENVKPDLIAISVTTPIVGTDLFTVAKNENLLNEIDMSGYNRLNISTMQRTLSDQEIKELIKAAVSTYRKTLIKELLHPSRFIKRRYFLSAILMHWLTMVTNPPGMIRDISYYLNYQNKEKSILEHTT